MLINTIIIKLIINLISW